jgi:uncharacterized membrane protein
MIYPPLILMLVFFFVTLYPGEFRAPCAYLASPMETLIGADLIKVREITKMGAPIASIGGASTFDAIFLSGISAVLLS